MFPATSEFAGGAGTLADPYQVATAEQLNSVRNHFDKYFIQTADIDLTSFVGVGGAGYNDGKGWLPIRSNSSDYNGNNKTISNLKIHRPDEDGVGLFYSNYGSIENVSLSNVDVIGNSYVGGLVGSNEASGSFIGKITDSHVTTGSVKGSGVDIGGLVGFNTPETEIKNSSSGASVSPNGSSIRENIGGLVGRNGGTISASHATGNVEGKSQIGGLVGGGDDSSAVTDSYWDTETSLQTTSFGGIGKTTNEMKDQSTYTGWDFPATWNIDSTINNGYPHLGL